jgi:hypothetical protein
MQPIQAPTSLCFFLNGHPSPQLPNPIFCLTQGRRNRAPMHPEVYHATAFEQICVPVPNSPMLTISGFAVELCAALSPPRHLEGPLGEPLHAPDPARVSSRSVSTGGRRRLGVVDRNLIGRPWLPRTLSASRPADGRALPGRPVARAAPTCACAGMGHQCWIGPGPD